MADRDDYGNYVNDEGVTIKIHDDKSGKTNIDFYDNDVDKSHSAIHFDYNCETGKYDVGYHNETKTERSSSSGSCYLTTACLIHMKEDFDDNCHELTVLRWFRDNYVSKDDVEHYYKTAPIIVEAINNVSNNETIYDYIYNNIVSVCVKEIENGNYDNAYTRYRNSILSFEEIFAKPLLRNKLVKTLKKVKN